MANRLLTSSMYRETPTAPVESDGVIVGSCTPFQLRSMVGRADAAGAGADVWFPAAGLGIFAAARCLARSYAAWSGTRYPCRRKTERENRLAVCDTYSVPGGRT